MEFNRNNLHLSNSLYLRQHGDNPIWWQEWGQETLDEAVRTNKPLFISIGYSSCHWCHVMAREAFSDHETARFLNSNFICIKVDREERPDIDQFMMDYIVSKTGSGGWPLNVFSTPDLKPMFALTYAPKRAQGGRESLVEIAKKVKLFYDKGNKITSFQPTGKTPRAVPFESLEGMLTRIYDREHGGFGHSQKFPPHSTLLFMLYSLSYKESPGLRSMVTATLEAMRLRGLNDHLQGGIFRYCVDREWNIPHFEKMLYDQALAIWYYSLAYHVLGKEEYGDMAHSIIDCLDNDFSWNGLFLNSIDADTDHVEGGSYLWSYQELKEILGDDFDTFKKAYEVEERGNFQGKIHLIRKNDMDLDHMENELLEVRNRRTQPHADHKFISGLNGLVIAALTQASIYLQSDELHQKAGDTMNNLLDTFWIDGKLAHSMSNGHVQKNHFLYDGAACLLALTMLLERDPAWKEQMEDMLEYVDSFKRDGEWLESHSLDFLPVPASWHDNPIPSSISLAELSIARANMLLDEPNNPARYRSPHSYDAYNINAMLRNGICSLLEPVGKKGIDRI